MLTIPFIRENKDNLLEGLKIKNFKSPEMIDQIMNWIIPADPCR